jgi:hypothetical protein
VSSHIQAVAFTVIEVNIAIMRAFVKLRRMLESNEQLNRKFPVLVVINAAIA